MAEGRRQIESFVSCCNILRLLLSAAAAPNIFFCSLMASKEVSIIDSGVASFQTRPSTLSYVHVCHVDLLATCNLSRMHILAGPATAKSNRK